MPLAGEHGAANPGLRKFQVQVGPHKPDSLSLVPYARRPSKLPDGSEPKSYYLGLLPVTTGALIGAAEGSGAPYPKVPKVELSPAVEL